MLSEERIKKMIRLSDFENGQGRTDLKRIGYLKMDYVRLVALKTVVSVVVAAVLILLLVCLYHMEYILQNFLALPFGAIALYGGGALVAVCMAVLIISCRMASRQYDESKIRVKEYYTTLKELQELYESEEQEKEERRV